MPPPILTLLCFNLSQCLSYCKYSIIHWDCADFYHHRATNRWVAMKARKLANYLTVIQNWICCCKTKPQWHKHILWYRCRENFFHEVFTMIIAKLQYLHTRGKLSASSIEHYHSPIAHSLFAEVTSIFKIFPHRFWWTKCEGTLLTLMYNRISKGSHSLASHTVHRERKGLVMLQLSSCSHGNQSALRSS